MEIREVLKKVILEKIDNGEDPLPSIIGQESAKRQLLSSLIAGRNVVIVGPPGTGKTTIAKNVAKLLPSIEFPEGVPLWAYPEFPFTPEEFLKKWETGPFIKLRGEQRFIRVQGSYDLSVEDLIGDIDPMRALKYGVTSVKSFVPGKVFLAHKGVLFFDEMNRAPPKVQNALLQMLEEKRVTIGQYEFEIPIDLIFIATMNPEDYSGVERLSDVLLDRFDVVYMNYPSKLDEEKEIIVKKGKKITKFPENLLNLLVEFVFELRKDENLEKKPSVRTSIGIYEKAQALAVLDKKREVELQHLYEAILSVLPHRIRLKPSVKLETSEKKYVEDKWEVFRRSKNLDFFQIENFRKNKEGFFREDFDLEKNIDRVFEKAIERGLFRIDEKALWDEFEENIEVISEITGVSKDEVRQRKDSRFRRELKEKLLKNLKKMKKAGYLNEDGTFSEKMLRKFSVKVIKRFEENLLGISKSGKYESNFIGKDELLIFKSYGIGDSYFEINSKLSVRNYVKGKNKFFVVEKKKERKGGNFFVLLDCSGSMYGKKILEAKKALMALIYKAVEDGNKVSILLYNDKVVKVFDNIENIPCVLSEILKVQPIGGTNIALALKFVLERTTPRSSILLITDAIPTIGKNPLEDTLKVVRELGQKSCIVSVVGINLDKEGEENAKKISMAGKGRVYLVKNIRDLSSFVIWEYKNFMCRS